MIFSHIRSLDHFVTGLFPLDGCVNELNENEFEVLRILWELGELKPADIQSNFGWEIENATLRSVLRNLLEKGFLVRKKQGKAFLYRARSRRGAQFARTMDRMAEIFTGGSKTELILELLRHEKLSAEEVATLQKIAERKNKKA